MFAGSDLRNYKSFVHSFLKHSWKPVWNPHSVPEESHKALLTVEHSFNLFNKYNVLPTTARVTQVSFCYSRIENIKYKNSKGRVSVRAARAGSL